VRGCSRAARRRSIVEGLKVERDGAIEDMRADVTSMPAAATRLFPDWLRAEGVEIAEEESPAAFSISRGIIACATAQDEPPRDGTPGGGDLGYIKFGVFIADNRHFSDHAGHARNRNRIAHGDREAGDLRRRSAAMPGAARWMIPRAPNP
jgi:hypothetical protein